MQIINMVLSYNDPELFDVLRTKLNLSDIAAVKEEPVLTDASINLRADMIIEDQFALASFIG